MLSRAASFSLVCGCLLALLAPCAAAPKRQQKPPKPVRATKAPAERPKSRPNPVDVGNRASLPLPLKLLWLDNEVDPASTESREKIARLLDKAKSAGFNVIVPDARNYFGLAYYDSALAPRANAGFDYLKTVVEEAHARGLRVHAGLNIFVDGSKDSQKRIGAAWDHPEWQSVVYDAFTQVALADAKAVRIAALNDFATSGISVFTPAYGFRLFAQDAVGNVTDGIIGRAASRWVSASGGTRHFLRFEWETTQAVSQVIVHFPKGYPARIIEAHADDVVTSVGDNSSLRVSMNMLKSAQGPQRAAPPYARSAQIDFLDPGADGIARVEEVEILDWQQQQIAGRAKVTADSSMSRGKAWFATVADGRVTSVASELSYTGISAPIPRDGCILVLPDKPTDELVGKTAQLQAEPDLMREQEYPGGRLLYTNPANADVQNRAIEIIREALTKYEVDGVILDRVRFDNLKTDFSDVSRAAFEKEIRQVVAKWPADIYVPANPLSGEPMRKAPLFSKWVLWRAKVIHDFMDRVREAVRKAPGKHLGDYVGSWYDTYWEVGANWAVPSYKPGVQEEWRPAGYETTAYADSLDYLSPGVYFSALRKGEAQKSEESIEGALESVQEITGGGVPLAPGIYVPNLNSDGALESAIRMCIENAGGVMVFSHSSLEKMNRWEACRRALEAVPKLPE